MKKANILFVPALLCALYLSAELTILGLDKFYYILAGGGKFATFPDWHSQVAIGLSYLVLQLIYLVWFLGTHSRHAFSRFNQIFRGTIVFLGIAFIGYPLGNDIYLYLHSGLMNLNQANPYLVRAGAFLSELSPFVDWGQTSTYGPVSQLLFTLSAASLSIHPLLAVYVFKAICLGLHILNAYLLWHLLQPLPERGKVTIAYLINPLLLFEQVSSAHIDIAVSTSLILAVICLARWRYGLAFLAMWVGLLSKTLPLIWMPLVGVFLLRYRLWRSVLVISLSSVGLLFLLSLTVFPSLTAWKSLLNPGVVGQYKASLHELAKFGLDWFRLTYPGVMTLAEQNQWLLKLTTVTKLCFVAIYALYALKIWRQRHYSELNLVEDLGWVTLILLLLATPWVMPWYASVMITFAAVLPRARLLGLTSLMFSLSSSTQYLLLGLDGISCLLAIGLPILAFIFGADLFLPRSLEYAEPVNSTAKSSAPDPGI
jgi:alpha-1,6-mannosyltransferase